MSSLEMGFKNKDRTSESVKVGQSVSVLSTSKNLSRRQTGLPWRSIVEVNCQPKGIRP
jgi:hypothetical protein